MSELVWFCLGAFAAGVLVGWLISRIVDDWKRNNGSWGAL